MLDSHSLCCWGPVRLLGRFCPIAVILAYAFPALADDDFKTEPGLVLKDLAAKTGLTVSDYEAAKKAVEAYGEARAAAFQALLTAFASGELNIRSAWDDACSRCKSALAPLVNLPAEVHDAVELQEFIKSEQRMWSNLADMKIPENRKTIFNQRGIASEKTAQLD